jgi:hypothetical protein
MSEAPLPLLKTAIFGVAASSDQYRYFVLTVNGAHRKNTLIPFFIEVT